MMTPKGRKIMAKMRGTYHDPEEAKRVFYASANKGTITGVHAGRKRRPRRRPGGNRDE
jgi:hypothetical protein